MRRAVLLITTMAASLAVASGVALAAVIDCTGGLCVGTNDNDTMTGTDQVDDMRGRDGNDEMRGRDRGDLLLGQDDNDRLFGQAGADDLAGDLGNDDLTGGSGGDDLDGGATGNEEYFFADGWGNDTLVADGGGTDTLDFSALTRNVTVRLYMQPLGDEATSFDGNTLNFPNTVVIEDAKGGAGNDYIIGNDGPNRLFGNDGGDGLNGRGGNDALNGGDSADLYEFGDGWGNDTIADSSGTADALNFYGVTSTVVVNLEASDVAVEATSGSNTVDFPSTVVIERATGGNAGDFLYGNGLDNYLQGFDGNDELRGEGGADFMSGGTLGDDKFYGGGSGDTMLGVWGDDKMYGGSGTDTVYGDSPYAPAVSGNDTIDVSDGDARDTVDCGPGTDTVYVDTFGGRPIDAHQNCERINPGRPGLIP